MVGFVLVSHSRALAEALAEYTRVMAPDVAVAAAGGLADGSFGTSYRRIQLAVQSVNGSDGVIVLMDAGSAVLTAKMVAEDMEDDGVNLVDCPFVEGAIEGTVLAQGGASRAEIARALAGVCLERKL